MGSEDSANAEDVCMKLLSNKGERPDYNSGSDLDVTINVREESENISDTFEYRRLQQEPPREHMEV